MALPSLLLCVLAFTPCVRLSSAHLDASVHRAVHQTEHALSYINMRLLQEVDPNTPLCAMCTVEANVSHVSDGQFVQVKVNTSTYATGGEEENQHDAHNRNTHWLAVYSPANADVRKTTPIKYAILGEKYVDASGKAKKSTFRGGKEYVETGIAKVNMQLIDMRTHDFAFYVFSGGLDLTWGSHKPPSKASATLLTRSRAQLSMPESSRPRRPRAALAKEDTLRLTWSDAQAHKGTFRYEVWAGEKLVAGPSSATVKTTYYEADDMCNEPATTYGYRDAGLQHTADIPISSSWDDGAKIRYCLDGVENCYTLRLPRRPGRAADGPTVLLLTADMGQGVHPYDDSTTWPQYGQPSHHVVRNMIQDIEKIDSTVAMHVAGGNVSELRAHAVFHSGDLSYAIGFAAVWDWWLWTIEELTSKIVYFTNPGNHEFDAPKFPADRPASWFRGTDSGGECGVPAAKLMPSPRAGIDRDWWSVDIGLVHMVSINTEADITPGSPQHEWLARDLASVNRSVTPWIVLGGHRPMYIDSTYVCNGADPFHPNDSGGGGDHEPCDIDVAHYLKMSMEPLLLKHEVDLAFWGHSHVMQRHCAAYNGTCVTKSVPWLPLGANTPTVAPARPGDPGPSDTPPYVRFVEPKATIHLVVGTAGAKHYKNAFGDATDERCLYEYGHVRFYAFNATHALWEFVSLGPIPEASESKAFNAAHIRDTILIERAASPWKSASSPTASSPTAVASAVIVFIVVMIGVGAAIWAGMKLYRRRQHPLRHDSFTRLEVVEMEPFR